MENEENGNRDKDDQVFFPGSKKSEKKHQTEWGYKNTQHDQEIIIQGSVI